MVILTTKQAAKILMVSDSMVRRFLRTESLTGRKFSPRGWYVYQDDKFSEQQERLHKKTTSKKIKPTSNIDESSPNLTLTPRFF